MQAAFALRLARMMLQLKMHLLRAIAHSRATYQSVEYADHLGNEPWSTDDAHELETWGHRWTQPRSLTMEF
jgi:hypothetical protein